MTDSSSVRKMNFKNVKVPNVPGGGAASALIKFGAIAGLGLYGVANSLYNVDGGHRAIVFNRLVGVKDKVYPEGTHLMIPWFERPIIYDVRARPHLVESTSGSRDLQMVKIGLRVLTRPVASRLPTVYRTLGENYNERVLPSIIHETLKAVVAQYNASQLITQREAVSREIRKILTERAANFNIALDDVSITSLTFGREFTAAIEAKQVAAQEAERAKFVVEKAGQDKRSAIIRAQGEAKSASLIGQAIANNPSFITLRKIEAAREIAHVMSNAANKTYLNSGDLLLNLQGVDSGSKKPCILSRASSEEHMPVKDNSESIMLKRYENWLAKHKRKYSSRDEWELRFGIYQSNVQFIDYINSHQLSYKLVDNKFADMTDEEFNSIYLGYTSVGRSTKGHNFTTEKTQKVLPTSMDWRMEGAVTPIKDQGTCGTEISFSLFPPYKEG